MSSVCHSLAIISFSCILYFYCTSFSQASDVASLGMRQSPRGLMEMLPTLGPSGRHERLNCWLKKRRMKVLSHLRMVSSSYVPLKVREARKNILAGRKPKRRK